jgi:hypothetical protein
MHTCAQAPYRLPELERVSFRMRVNRVLWFLIPDGLTQTHRTMARGIQRAAITSAPVQALRILQTCIKGTATKLHPCALHYPCTPTLL